MSIGKKSAAQVNQVRKKIYFRDGQCVVQGTPYSLISSCSGAQTIQHRVTRGMGSSALYDSPNALLVMCAYHNTLEPRDAAFRKICEYNGWSVKRWKADKFGLSLIPVLYDDGWYLLENTMRTKISLEYAKQLLDAIHAED